MNILTDYNVLELNNSLEEIPETTGVYAYINEETGHMYIGQSINLRKRYIEHMNNSRSKIDKALNINPEIFSYRIIIQNVDASVLASIEASYINQFHTVEFGYNVRNDKLKAKKIEKESLIMQQEYQKLSENFFTLQKENTELVLAYNELLRKYNHLIEK